MHPVLFEIFGLPVYTYGVALATAFYLAVQWAVRKGREKNLHEESILNLAIISIISAIVGARITYVFLKWDYYSVNLLEIIQIYKGGLVFFGGLGGGIFGGVAYWLYLKKPLLLMCDIAAMCVILGQSVGRIGCFFYGCCFGIHSNLPWAVKFPLQDGLRHPTQIYESLGNFLIFLFLAWLFPKIRRSGLIVVAYFYLYGVLRFSIEMIRDDYRGTILGITSLSTSQTVSLIGIFLAAILHIWLMRQPVESGRESSGTA